jgi:hypothetical protein
MTLMNRMSTPCPKCGALLSWDGKRCCRQECRFGSDLPPIVKDVKALPNHPVASLSDLFTRRFSGPVVGLSIDDLIDALRVVASMEGNLDKRVMSCRVTDSGMVYVRTGEWPGPMAGGGANFLLKKTEEGWVVIETSGWC